MAFSGTPFMFDDPQQPTDIEKLEAEPLATEKTLQGIRMGNSIIQDDLGSINRKLSQSGDLYGILTDIADVLDSSSIARHSKSPLESLLENQHKEAEKWNISKGGSFLGTKDPNDPTSQGTLQVAEESDNNLLKKIEINTMHTRDGIGILVPYAEKQYDALKKINKNIRKGIGGKVTPEDEIEGDKADKTKGKNEKKQTGFLATIAGWAKKQKDKKRN